MSHWFRSATVVGLLLMSVVDAAAQDPAGPPPDGRGGGGFRGQGGGPLGDPGQFPQPPGGRMGRLGGPARDDPQAPQGTAKLAGRIVAADSGNPIRRAQVRVNAPEARTNRVATTDNQGRYEITGLPAARYRLQVSKAGYVTLEYGQARPFEAGKPLDLADAQVLDKIDFSLPRGSVITGRISDEFGDPIADASVQAMRYQFNNGVRQLVNTGRTGTSDDIGQFRIFGLMPGDYLVRASVRGNAMIAAAVAGTEEPSGYPPTYYPGTTDVAQAQAVTVALGQELTSVNLSLAPARLAMVSGSVLGSDGKPLNGAVVMLRPARGGGAGGALNVGGANQVRADGSFTLTSVPPGEYSLDVQQRPRNLQNGISSQLEFASIPLGVTGEDISGLTILTTAGVSASGRVTFQGQNNTTPSGRGMQVTASAPSGAQSIIGIAGRALGGGRVDDAGAFELRGLFGPQLLRVTGIPAGWALKSISLGNEDITDTGFDFRPGANMTGVVVTLTDRLTEISGTVRDRDQPSKDYVLVVFPEDVKLWGGQSRFIRTARPNQDGNFSLKGLPPARYLAVAVESLESGSQNDPALLERLRPLAKSFTLTDGQTLGLTLTLSTGSSAP